MKGILIIGTGFNPSEQANSIQLLHQAHALLKFCDIKVLCGFRRNNGISQIHDQYGLDFQNKNFVNTVFFRKKAVSLQIGVFSFIWYFCFANKLTKVYSRNFYFTFLQAIFRREGTYEAHMLETGMRRKLERFIYNTPSIKVIAISNGLRADILRRYRIDKEIMVLPDAALEMKREKITFNAPVRSIGYFGSKISGRGIEVIIELAKRLPELQFVVYGPGRIKSSERLPKNLSDEDHIPFRTVTSVMRKCDVLLMPYQKKVSINLSAHDTVNWMSPLKMFDYMASGVPFISSDLPVLREILHDEKNCLLAGPDNITEWISAIQKLQNDASLREVLSRNAVEEIRKEYNWQNRAKTIFEKLNA